MKSGQTVTDILNKDTVTLRDRTTISLSIEDMFNKTDMSYAETIVAFCDQYDIEVEQVPKLITSAIKDKLEVEAREANLLKSGRSSGLDAWL